MNLFQRRILVFSRRYHNRLSQCDCFKFEGIPVREDLWEKWYLLKDGTSEPSETAVKNAQDFSNTLEQIVTARFLCTVDTLGIEINNMFKKDGYVDLDRPGVDEDIELAADMLYNNTRYIVME